MLQGLLIVLLIGTMTACATRVGKDGRSETTVDAKYLAKTEIDRVADLSRSEVVGGLLAIADKLYKRNPREWKRGGQVSREAAVERLRQWRVVAWPEFNGLREGPAAALAFTDSFAGDRVAALVYGLLTMVEAAFEYKDEFYLFDALDERKLFHCARNLDVAVWKLGHDRQASGELFLLSNELDPGNRNISYEREFGRLMGLLDLTAKIVADRNGRSLSRLTHSVATTLFLPVGFLK